MKNLFSGCWAALVLLGVAAPTIAHADVDPVARGLAASASRPQGSVTANDCVQWVGGGAKIADAGGACMTPLTISPAGVPPEAYGAVCDGVVGSAVGTDNFTALQNWLNAGAAGTPLGGNGKVCNFKTALSLSNPNGLRFVGAGPYQTVLQYTGATTTTTLLTLGSTSGATTSNVYLQGLKFASSTALTSGFALVLANMQESTLRDLTFDGLTGNGKLWGGLWCNQCADIKMFGGDIYAAGDALRVNGTVGAGAKAEFLTAGTRIRGHGASSVGVHIAGGFGGFSCTAYTSIDSANVNFLIDTSVANEGNREIFVNPDCIVDSALTDNVQVNDAGPVTGGGGHINLQGWNSGAGRYGVNVISWASGWIEFGQGPFKNSASDIVRLSDSTANYVFGSSRLTSAGGWGINCTVAIGQVYAQPGPIFASNTSGNWASNCAQQIPLDGAAWTAYTPTVTSASGTFTSVSATGAYKKVGKTVVLRARITITTNGTAAGDVRISLPVAGIGASSGVIAGRNNTTGTELTGVIATGLLAMNRYDGAYPGADGYVLDVGGSYEAQ